MTEKQVTITMHEDEIIVQARIRSSADADRIARAIFMAVETIWPDEEDDEEPVLIISKPHPDDLKPVIIDEPEVSNGRAKVTDDDVLALARKYPKDTPKELAAKLNCNVGRVNVALVRARKAGTQ